MKVLKTYDDFLWLDVTDIAKSLWQSQDFELYAVYEDHTEHLINTEMEFEAALMDKCIIAIELCHLNQITNI